MSTNTIRALMGVVNTALLNCAEGDERNAALEASRQIEALLGDLERSKENALSVVNLLAGDAKPDELPAPPVADDPTQDQIDRAKPAVRELFFSKGVELKPEEINLAASVIVRASLQDNTGSGKGG